MKALYGKVRTYNSVLLSMRLAIRTSDSSSNLISVYISVEPVRMHVYFSGLYYVMGYVVHVVLYYTRTDLTHPLC